MGFLRKADLAHPGAGDWRAKDRAYHEDQAVVKSYDQRIARQYGVEHQYFTVEKWIGHLHNLSCPLVLDFGCGTGAATLRLLKHGIRVISVDASHAMLEQLRQKAHALQLPAECLQAEVEKLPFPANHFDAVMCLGVLHHLFDVALGVENQARVLKPGGWLFIAEPFTPRPFLSWPYHGFVGIARGVRHLMKNPRVSTYERLLSYPELTQIEEKMRQWDLDYTLNYLVYWPLVCGHLPEKLAGLLMGWLNRLPHGPRADSIIIVARKRP